MHNFSMDNGLLMASRNASLALANATALQSAVDPVLRRVGFWGDPTATVDWCELNYQHSPYIAEFWNTVSNVLFVILGSYGLVRSIREKFEWRFRFLFVSTVVIGLGSAMFHGTLQMVHQQFDETPMIWGMLVWIYIVYNKEIRQLPFQEKTVITAFTAFGVSFAVLHAIYQFTLVFQLLFGALAWACLFRITTHYNQSTDARARAVCKTSMYASLLGFGLWMLDYNYCGHISELPFNPQCHAWWHLLMGVCTYNAPLFMQFVRAEELQKKPELVDAAWVGLQTIVIHDGTAKAKTL